MPNNDGFVCKCGYGVLLERSRIKPLSIMYRENDGGFVAIWEYRCPKCNKIITLSYGRLDGSNVC